MIDPWYIAVRPLGPSSGKRWNDFLDWSGFSHLTHLVSFDQVFCPSVIQELEEEDWRHNVDEDYVIFFFRDLEYLLQRTSRMNPVSILAAFRNPTIECRDAFSDPRFFFRGYDVVDVCADISALTSCGGFPKVFATDELSPVGLISSWEKAFEIQRELPVHYPKDTHTECDVWALWEMADSGSA